MWIILAMWLIEVIWVIQVISEPLSEKSAVSSCGVSMSVMFLIKRGISVTSLAYIIGMHHLMILTMHIYTTLLCACTQCISRMQEMWVIEIIKVILYIPPLHSHHVYQ